MPIHIPEDLAEKAAIMREFGRLRAAGEHVPPELHVRHINATNDRYTTGPEPGERIPDFSLPRPGRRFEITRKSRRSQWPASRFLSKRRLVTVLPFPTRRVGAIAFDRRKGRRPHRRRQLRFPGDSPAFRGEVSH